ncbi:hypothetical protein IFM89_011283 [Coptis chinensis]|uniref:Beta-glucosidase n=1 Tax=Coptis chinensis TaxID=261450 RepID=A0A835LZ97_9MAGN|nr:hypothetical protein IFM89_011283 [Coptis chinensis]
MSDIGLEAYRFSISWSRLLSCTLFNINGRGAINPKGLQYYNGLIDELVSNGIQPHVTLYHLDHPQILEEEYAGWLSPKFIEDFTAFADVCFREFGDRVAHWTTVNEPNIMCLGSYNSGQTAPRQCSSHPGGKQLINVNCNGREGVVKMHRAKQKGLIGLSVYAFWCTPMTNSNADMEATQRATDFYTGWALNPLVFGDYPKIMKKNVGSRIPSFTKRESELVKGSFDFIGLNHYYTAYIQDIPQTTPKTGRGDFNSDMNVKFSLTKDDTPPGPFAASSTLYNPSGLQSVLLYFKDYYGNPPVYIQENGFGGSHNETLNDTGRIHYVNGYMGGILDAIRSGSNARGYFVWSFLDVFEILSGYQTRYGLVHVDFEEKDLKRRPKLSAQWVLVNSSVDVQVEGTVAEDGRTPGIWDVYTYDVIGLAQTNPNFSRDEFPSNFVFGAGTAAYQVEGAVAEDGRTPSIWDIYTHKGLMPDKSTGDIASDGYHKYKVLFILIFWFPQGNGASLLCYISIIYF